MNARRLSLASCASLCLAMAVLLVLAGAAFAALPDNRAYEMVSPVDKGGASTCRISRWPDASGDHVIVDGGVQNALLSNGASWMLETRTSTGWSGVQIGPPPGEAKL